MLVQFNCNNVHNSDTKPYGFTEIIPQDNITIF